MKIYLVISLVWLFDENDTTIGEWYISEWFLNKHQAIQWCKTCLNETKIIEIDGTELKID